MPGRGRRAEERSGKSCGTVSCRAHRPSTAGWPPPKQAQRRRQPLRATTVDLHGQATGPPCPKGRANTTSPEIDRTEIEGRTGSLGFVPVDSSSRWTYLAGDMGEAALDSAQFRARQGAARDEAKEIKKGQNRRASRYSQTEEQQRGGRESTRKGRRHRET